MPFSLKQIAMAAVAAMLFGAGWYVRGLVAFAEMADYQTALIKKGWHEQIADRLAETFGGDQIVVDGEKIGKFDCQDAGGPLSKLYGKAEGIVEFATVGQSRGVDGRGNKVLIVVLNNAINSEVTEADIAEEKRFKAEAKAAAKEATKLNGVRYLSGSTDF